MNRSPNIPSADPIAAQSPRHTSEDDDGSTTPRATRQSSLESYWPRRSNRISRRTASAILYTLEEAIRTPFLFTPDLVEENASMTDLVAGGPGNGRAQNGGAASGPVPVPQYPSSGVRTPTDIMRQRRDREARRKAESDAKQREQEDDEQRRLQEEARLNSNRRSSATVGVGGTASGGEDATNRRSRGASAARRSGGEAPISQDTATRRQGDRVSSSGIPRANPSAAAQPSTYVPAGARTEEQRGDMGDVSNVPQATSARPRGASISQAQPRPVQQQTSRAASATYSTQQQPSQTRQASATGATSQAQAGPSAVPSSSQQALPRETTGGTQQRNPNTSSFPHAFERWETLSSHWEGLTSFWIRRLQENGNEMNREPLNQQLARQVTDLSAAGANLFHAVVELQRLRASSERKFQRWFFETRAEQERAQEEHAGMDNTLRVERQGRADAVANLARMESEKNNAYQMKNTAEQLVKEMKRELQISKEEARRAWEELGRREQEERDRTTSLRNGEPTLVGGVQVVPMMQGASSRQASTNRPSTRDGPLPPGPPVFSGSAGQPEAAESPVEGEPGYTTYDAARSETDTDPFTESGRGNPSQPLHREPDLQALPPIATQPRQQPPSTSATPAAQPTRAAPLQEPNSLPTESAPTSSLRGGTYLRYGPAAPTTEPPNPSSFYQHQGSALHDETQPRTTEPDARSFVPSVDDTISEEEEYELDENGELLRDPQGRPMISRRAVLGSEDSDEYDVREQMERERMYSQRYGSGVSGVEYGSGDTITASGRRGERPAGGIYGGGGSGVAPSGEQGDYGGQGGAQADYSGSGYGSGLGWEAVPRHHHPTRLSDVLEEDERSRTSPSRASQTSRGLR